MNHDVKQHLPVGVLDIDSCGAAQIGRSEVSNQNIDPIGFLDSRFTSSGLRQVSPVSDDFGAMLREARQGRGSHVIVCLGDEDPFTFEPSAHALSSLYALCVDVDGVHRLTRRHEQSVSLKPAKANIGATFG